MYLIETIRTRERFGKILKLGVAYTFVAVAAASPWYIKNYLWFHNPIYHFVTGEVAEFGEKGVRYFNAEDERRLDAHFDAARKEIPEAVSQQEEDLRQAINARVPRHPMRLWEFFTKPSTYLMSEPYQFPNYLFLIIPLMVFLKKDKWVVWLLILSLAFVFSVTLTSWIARYLLPAYPPLTIVAAYTLTTISTRLGERISFARRVPVYALAVALATVIATCAASFRQFHSPSFVAGTISRHEFMAPLSYYRPINFINTQLPPNARVMIIGAQMNYGIKRDYLTDESWFATKWRRLLVRNDSLEGVNEDLKRQGFTHIFYNPELFTYAALMGVQGTGGMNLIARGENEVSEEATRLGPEYPLLRNWSTFTLFRMKFLEPVYSDENGYQIFKIR